MLQLALLFLMSPFGQATDLSVGFSDASTAPTPEVVSLQKLLPDEWQAKIPQKKENKLYPLITDKNNATYYAEDARTGEILYASNADTPRPIASITKLMTALLILENHALDEEVTVSKKAVNPLGASIELKAEETLLVRDLVAASIIPSANDAARALAIHHSGSEEKFVEKMNEKAKDWGLDSAIFYNATGLDEIKDSKEMQNTMHAKDVVALAKKAWKNPTIKQFAQMGKLEIGSVDGKFIHQAGTTNQLLGNFQGILGLKTGYTEKAGQCVVTVAKKDGNDVFIVVLGSADRFRATKQLLAWVWGAWVW